MANDKFEKDYDDEVYEDDYYEEHYEEEELNEEADDADDLEAEEELFDDEKRIHLSFACEDCDYRWDDMIVKKKTGNIEDEEEIVDYDTICPMCGSMNVTQI